VPIAWADISGNPLTYPPTLPITESDVVGLVSDLAAKEALINKGVANGYASLDSSAKIPAGQLPSYVDQVLEFVNLAAFPTPGTAGIIYVALDTNKVYRWGGSAYTEISPSPGSSDAVPEGSTNLYYTTARSVLKADLDSPILTGDPRAPTQAPGDNDTSIATTAFVTGTVAVSLALKADLDSPILTGDPRAPTPTAGDNDTSIATTQFVTTAVATSDSAQATALALKANLASPTFTGDPKAPTPTAGDNDTSIATTAFVTTAVATSDSAQVTALALKANLASPTFTGDPKAPTPTAGDNDTSIATTAFVTAAVSAGGGGGGISEAPNDGLQYGRKSLTWTEIVAQFYGTLQNYLFNATTTTPPAAGTIRLNNATQTAATIIWFNYTTNDAVAVNLKTYFLQRIKIGDTFYIQDKDDISKWQLYKINAAFTDSGTYASVPVTWIAGGSALSAARVVISREGAGVDTPVGEAPNDAAMYGRKSLGWARSVDVAGDTMTGDLVVSKASPLLAINKAASGQDGILAFRTGGTLRWQLASNTTAESSGAGSNLEIRRYNDAGTLLDVPVTINRSTGAITSPSSLTVRSGTSIPAGGTAGAGVMLSSTSNFGVFFGSGVPTLTAAQGSIYLRSDGVNNNTRVYVNINGTTGWSAMNVIAVASSAPSSPATNDVWIDTT
jgi:hypothetical protein